MFAWAFFFFLADEVWIGIYLKKNQKMITDFAICVFSNLPNTYNF